MWNMRVSRRVVLGFVLLALVAAVPIVWVLCVAQAASRTWTGGTPGDPTCPPANNFWTNQCNWTSKVMPVTNDDLIFPASLQQSSLNTFANGTTFNSISVSGAHLMSGNSVSLNSGITANNGLIGLSSIKLNNNQTFNAPTAGTGAAINSAIDNNGKLLSLDGPGIFQINGIISGTGGLTQRGTGTTLLAGANSYTGTTTISRGTLLVFGSQPGSNVSINPSEVTAVLGGSGTVAGIMVGGSGGIISPGGASNGSGILTANGNVGFSVLLGGVLSVDLNTATVGSGYDQLKVNGTVTLGQIDPSLAVLSVQLGFTPPAGSTFTIIENDGTDAVSGEFSGKREGSSFVVDRTTFFISYRGGNGNDVVLHVPETKTWSGAGGNSDWTTGANWSGGTSPQVGDHLVFPPGASRQTNTNDFPSGTTFTDILIPSGFARYNILGTNTVNLAAGIRDSSTSSSSNIFNPVITGPGGVTRDGSGSLTLVGNNTYTGTTVLDSGFLRINGSQPSSPVTVNSGVLEGNGTLGPLTANAGTLVPFLISSSLNALTVNGNATLNADTLLAATLKPINGAFVNNQLKVNGTVTLNNLQLQISYSGGIPPEGSNFKIIDNDGTDAVVGTFNNQPEGYVYVFNSPLLGITYRGGDGNDVVVHVATTRTWDGGGTTNNWTEAANWVGDTAPGPGDNLVFPAGAARSVNRNDFPSGTTFNSIDLSGAGYSLAGNGIALNAGVTETVTSGSGNSVQFPIKLVANQTFSTAGPLSRTLTFFGGIDTNGRLLTLDGSGVCNFSNSPITGAGGIRRMGTGLSILFGNNTYTGATTISPGQLAVQGNQPNSVVNVLGGTLRGSGMTGPVNVSSGKIAPGGFGPPPVLTVQGSLMLSSNSTFETAVLGTAPNREFGRLDVNGPVDLGGAALSVIPNLPLPTGNAFIIVNNDGTDPVNGIFNSKPEGSTFTVGQLLFRISYSGGTGNDVVLTIVPALTIDNATVSEGNTSTVNATFTVNLFPTTSQTVTVNFATADSTATAGSDYVANSGTLTFNPNESSKTITVQVNGDTAIEPNETFRVNLTNPTNANLVEDVGVGTILNDDGPTTIQFTSANFITREDFQRATLAVTRTSDLSQPAAVNFATSDLAGLNNCSVVNGIASSRCDYPTSAGTVRFAAGEDFKTFSIPLVDDSYAEGNESFTVTLSNPIGAVLGASSSANVTIGDNETTNGPNPIDGTAFFVRQHYIDFLNREPDAPGFAAWQAVINNCPPGDTTCDRIHVSSAFFRSPEFQDRGYFVYRFYSVSFGRKPDYVEFIPDLARVSGFLSPAELEAAKLAFIDDFMARPAFANIYNPLNNTQYVDTLLRTAGITHVARDFWIAALGNGTRTRAQVLREISESTEVYNKYFNEAFVVMQYFGYLRRDPDALYLNWIQVLDTTGDFRGMVNGFMNSLEYRFRFGP